MNIFTEDTVDLSSGTGSNLFETKFLHYVLRYRLANWNPMISVAVNS